MQKLLARPARPSLIRQLHPIVVGLSQAKKRKNYADYNDEAHNIDDSVHNAFLCYGSR